MVSVLIHCVLWADFYPDRCIYFFDDTKKTKLLQELRFICEENSKVLK